MTAQHAALFDVPEELWVRRRCVVCGCALSVRYSHTYVVQRQGWVKIGATNNVRRRVHELARPTWVQHVLSPEGMDWSEPLVHLLTLVGHHEHELHARFAGSHAAGEWFRATPDLVAYLREQAAVGELLALDLVAL